MVCGWWLTTIGCGGKFDIQREFTSAIAEKTTPIAELKPEVAAGPDAMDPQIDVCGIHRIRAGNDGGRERFWRNWSNVLKPREVSSRTGYSQLRMKRISANSAKSKGVQYLRIAKRPSMSWSSVREIWWTCQLRSAFRLVLRV